MKTPILALVLAAASVSQAQAAELKPELAGVGFLVGDWRSGVGRVADTGATDTGGSQITVEADGSALLRRDHTETFDAHGRSTGGFHQIMLIYPEGGTLHADYSDGEGHVIHYVKAEVVAGKSVVFTAAPQAGAPSFRLRYSLQTPGELAVDFGMIPPGGGALRPIATGVLRRGR